MASPNQSPDPKFIPGLGIAQRGSVGFARQTSHHALIENAAPIGGRTEDTYYDGSPSVRDDFSPLASPEPARTPADDIRNSIHYAWDQAALGNRDERDIDAISLDSLQMHDEGADGEEHQPRSFGRHPDTPRVQFGGVDGVNDQTPLRGKKKAPKHVRIQRLSWVSIWLLIMSLYSTIMSGVWFFVAVIQPRWGSTISTNGPIPLNTANLLTAIFAKTIELSFATLAVAFVGQVLTRRAIATHEGMTAAEVSMRTWIAQPGAIFTNLGAARHVGRSLLGIMVLVATLVVMFYTTASDTMVRPKLQFSGWVHKDLNSTVWATYANGDYAKNLCATPIDLGMDPDAAEDTCLAIQYSGDSFSDFLDFLSRWRDIGSSSVNQAERPQAQSVLYNNVTMVGTWIETQYSNTTQHFETYSRVVNNASLAMPHAGVYRAATNRTLNGILQPSDLDGVGSYNISASVVSPAVNVLCVNMDADELAPIVYTSWPNAKKSLTGVGNQYQAWSSSWVDEVPAPANWTNTTVVDDIFNWHPTDPLLEINRSPPVFEMLPSDNNTVTYGSTQKDLFSTDSIYVLGKGFGMDNYTLCQMHSWPAIQCSTNFNVTGTTSMAMSADCSQSLDYFPENATLFTANPDAYVHTMNISDEYAVTKPDWRYMVQLWTLSMSLNSGNNNASIARILTQLALTSGELNSTLPSLAEALASLVANTLVTGAIDTPFIHYYSYNETLLQEPEMVSFKARVRNQEYASVHSEPWQGIFYVVLAAAFILNVLCLVYLCSLGLVKDFLDPTSLFAIATAPTRGGGGAQEQLRTPETDVFEKVQKGVRRSNTVQMGTPYLLNYREDGGHFYFEEAADGGKGTPRIASGVDVEGEGDQVSKRKSFGISFDSMRRLP